MKKGTLIILSLMSFAFLILSLGCNRNNRDTEKAIDYLKNLDSYTCDITMKIQNDKQVINYGGKQFYDKKYGYRFELEKSRILIYKDNKIFIKDLQNGLNYNTDRDFDSLFKLSFIGEYIGMIYTNETLKNSFKKINNEEYQVIHLDIPGNNKNISKSELYIDLKDNSPKYLRILDSKDREKVNIEYSNFKANTELQQELFDVNS
ncbi:germination lipoprotein GerS-related protein [Clostridium sp. A1-XYC3]|uniref:Germination lipoprotein GerS-related protein n=1 Tax=Clostridium tanneri TaxID=3037988 RepID=A0ABU4JPM1_9CLOT|nr:germination lipoprotein GerS-related protein [Clostridium sp. A1-XYC3]MDW8800096.1 germination lipoprotein GerS-related protein [Clostridium sp. A1-XYC3]